MAREEAEAWARSKGMLFLEASAKTRVGIKQVFNEVIQKVGTNTPSCRDGHTPTLIDRRGGRGVHALTTVCCQGCLLLLLRRKTYEMADTQGGVWWRGAMGADSGEPGPSGEHGSRQTPGQPPTRDQASRRWPLLLNEPALANRITESYPALAVNQRHRFEMSTVHNLERRVSPAIHGACPFLVMRGHLSSRALFA